MAMLVLWFVLDRDLRGPKAFLLDFRGNNMNTRQAERSHAIADRAQVSPGIDKRTERHVATNAASTVEISDPHGKKSPFWPRSLATRLACSSIVDFCRRRLRTF